MGNISEGLDRLQQPQRAGTSDGFGTALHLEFAKDIAVVPFDPTQGKEKPHADLMIRECLRHRQPFIDKDADVALRLRQS